MAETVVALAAEVAAAVRWKVEHLLDCSLDSAALSGSFARSRLV